MQAAAIDHAFTQAAALFEKRAFAEAAQVILSIIEHSPRDADAYYLLGLTVLNMGDAAQAVKLAEKALSINPAFAGALALKGYGLFKLGHMADGLNFYASALAMRPQDHNFLYAYGQMNMVARQPDAAKSAFEKVLQIIPAHPSATFLLDALNGRASPVAPPAFVKEYFDLMAESFDSKLVNHLGYRVPELIADVLAATLPAPAGNLNVYDAGCGTGLLAPILKPYAARLVGVDLSAGMLQKAAARGGYDELREAELVADMNSRAAESFDLSIVADVLVYIGDLAPFFTASQRLLAVNGYLVLTYEKAENVSENQMYELYDQARYRHAPAAVARLAEVAGFACISSTPHILRRDGPRDVHGMVEVWRRGTLQN